MKYSNKYDTNLESLNIGPRGPTASDSSLLLQQYDIVLKEKTVGVKGSDIIALTLDLLHKE